MHYLKSFSRFRATFALICFFTAFTACHLAATDCYAQKKKQPPQIQVTKTLERQFGLNHVQMERLRPLIKQSTEQLQIIYSKYSDRVDNGVLVTSAEPDIWYDLMKSRRKIDSALLGAVYSSSEIAAMRTAYSDLESETLSLLLVEIMSYLDGELDLSLEQNQQFYQILQDDTTQKLRIIADKVVQADWGLFSQKMNTSLRLTDGKITRLLFPEQRDTYKRIKQRSGEGQLKVLSAMNRIRGRIYSTEATS